MATKLSHPKGLYILFFTEMWERFSFYGMRALLVLYMTKYLLFDPEKARAIFGFEALERVIVAVFGEQSVQQMGSQIYGLYTGFVYLTPLFGGIIADRWLGRRKSVYLGGFLMAIGHFLMASEAMFLLALLFLVLGNGCFKPNISSQVGDLYEEGDTRRDSAFAIFYMGINLGAFFSPLVCGTLGQVVGWHWGFGAAGVGMLVGLVVYHFGRHHLPTQKVLPKEQAQGAVGSSSQKLSADDWRRVGILSFLCFLNITFWAIYEQQGNTMQLWAEDRTQWPTIPWIDFTIPSSWFQSFNPAMIVMFTPLLAWLWTSMARKGWMSSSVSKMGIGCILCGAAYIVMILAAMAVPEGARGSVMWLVGTTFLLTIGELYLSPTGLSLVTKVAPAKLVSTMMGAWFLSSFFGNYLTGYVGTFYDVMAKNDFFAMLALAGIVTGAIFFVVHKPISRVIGKDI